MKTRLQQWWYEWEELVRWICVYVSFLAFFLAIATAVSFLINQRSCYERWSASGYVVRYELFARCRVLVNGKWLPETALRNLLLPTP